MFDLLDRQARGALQLQDFKLAFDGLIVRFKQRNSDPANNTMLVDVEHMFTLADQLWKKLDSDGVRFDFDILCYAIYTHAFLCSKSLLVLLDFHPYAHQSS